MAPLYARLSVIVFSYNDIYIVINRQLSTNSMPELRAPQINKSYLLILVSLNFVSLEQLLTDTDFDQNALNDGDSLGVSDAIKLLNNLNSYSRTPNWAAIFGAHLGVATHGPVGYATTAAPTLGAALNTFVEWFRIRCETYTSEVRKEGDEMVIEILDTTSSSSFEIFFFEAFMRAFEVLITLIMGAQHKGQTTLELKTLAYNRKALMQEEYDSTLVFGAERNVLRVPMALWHQASPLSDPQAHQMNLRACEQIKEELEARGQLHLMVKQILNHHFESVISANKMETEAPTLREVCAQLHLTERTLIRKLKIRGTAYKQILEEQRYQFAKRMLNEARYTVADVADRLGYRESANFCRAFKKWAGESPTTYRRNPNCGVRSTKA